jgi:Cysteine-rich CWC
MSEALPASTCPRCGGGFECGAGTGHCDCFGIRLTEALRAELAERYPGRCLCLRCLRELMQCGAAAPAAAPP